MLWDPSFVIAYVLTSDWWEGLLQHSILSSQWWGNVLQGSLGSIVGLVGVFLIIRSELRRDERNRKEEREREQRTRDVEIEREERARQEKIDKESAERSKTSASAVRSVAVEIMLVSELEDESPMHLIRELLNFSAEEAVDYPGVLDWTYKHQINILRAMRHEKKSPLVKNLASVIAGALTAWLRDGRPENYFTLDDPDKDFEEILKPLGIELESLK